MLMMSRVRVHCTCKFMTLYIFMTLFSAYTHLRVGPGSRAQVKPNLNPYLAPTTGGVGLRNGAAADDQHATRFGGRGHMGAHAAARASSSSSMPTGIWAREGSTQICSPCPCSPPPLLLDAPSNLRPFRFQERVRAEA